jgi:membrane dipeptidase
VGGVRGAAQARAVIVDAHLDLAWTALHSGRDLTRPAERASGALTSLPELGAAGVALVGATLFAEPADAWLEPSEDGYRTSEEAEAQALAMLDVYRDWEARGAVRIVTGRPSLDDHLARFAQDAVPGLLLLIEGADPIVEVADLQAWWERGVRMIGLAWGPTRYAGGTGSDRGLAPIGAELLEAMADLGVIHDASHLSEEAFAEALPLPHHALCVTHATARALMTSVPGRIPFNRFLSDDQIRAVADRDGVIGLAMLNDFLAAGWTAGDPPVTLADHAAAHLRHIAGIAGWERVGIGSDVDAGHGRGETPLELDAVADWPRIGELAPPEARAGVLGGNWLRFLRAALPSS